MNDPTAVPPLSWKHRVLVFCVSLLLWLLLAGNLAREELAAGALVAAAVTLLFGARFGIFTGIRFRWLTPVYILHYLFDFFVALVGANLDLARRVLAPSLPLRPELVEVRTGLRSPLGKMLLANTITLTPGTLTVDIEGDRLLVHWVYSPPGMSPEEITRKIAGTFESRLSRFLI
ncbi:MAG TPA: cation:proton antiporter [Sedimenticola sp.]|nr:cation:proton antiporter [Sedimenticola sp.]